MSESHLNSGPKSSDNSTVAGTPTDKPVSNVVNPSNHGAAVPPAIPSQGLNFVNPTNTNHGAATKLKQQSRDTMHLITILCFVTCTSFWLASLFHYHPKAWWVIQNAFVALAVCFIADTTVACLAPSLETRLVLMHFSLGLVQNIIYILLFVMSPSIFQEVWTSLYFGYYLFTWIMMLTKKREFFSMFRVFYTVHHTISFFITGSWIIVSPCCSLDNNDFIYRAIMIWLSADIWIYSLNIYRSIWPNTDKNTIRRMQTAIFGIERLHRSTAYFQPLTVPSYNHNTLMWVVLGTGLFNDFVDSSFQLQSLCKYYRETKQLSEKKRCGSHVEEKEGDMINSPAAHRNATNEKEELITWEA